MQYLLILKLVAKIKCTKRKFYHKKDKFADFNCLAYIDLILFIIYYSILSYTMEQSTIKLSKKIKNDLKKQMNHPGETYEAVIARLLKVTQEDDILSKTVIKNIEEGIEDIKAGRVYTSEQVKKKLGLK